MVVIFNVYQEIGMCPRQKKIVMTINWVSYLLTKNTRECFSCFNLMGFGLFVGQNKKCLEITLGSEKVYTNVFTFSRLNKTNELKTNWLIDKNKKQ